MQDTTYKRAAFILTTPSHSYIKHGPQLLNLIIAIMTATLPTSSLANEHMFVTTLQDVVTYTNKSNASTPATRTNTDKPKADWLHENWKMYTVAIIVSFVFYLLCIWYIDTYGTKHNPFVWISNRLTSTPAPAPAPAPTVRRTIVGRLFSPRVQHIENIELGHVGHENV